MSLEEKYKSYSNEQLLEIVLKPEEYQPRAVEIAKAILSKREIDEFERIKVQNAIDIEKQTESLQKQKQLENQKSIIDFVKRLIVKINPFDNTVPVANKITTIALLVFGYLFLIQFYHAFRFLLLILKPPINFDIGVLLTLFEVVYLPVTIYLFIKKKKLGLLLLLMWLAYFLIATISILINSIVTASELNDSNIGFFAPYYMRLVFYVLLYTSFIILLSLKSVRSLFSVSTKSLIIAFGSVVIYVLVIVGIVLYFFNG